MASWNLQGALPPHNSLKLLFTEITEADRTRPDIIAIGTQECQRSLCMSFFCEDKQEWENMLADVSNSYTKVATETLQGLHLAILVRNELEKCCTVSRKTVLRAGTCNLLGNKGAVSICVNVLGQNFQFVNCHLAAQQDETERRNEILLNITDNLIDRDHRTEAFIFGDLNYRIDMSKSDYIGLLKQNGVPVKAVDGGDGENETEKPSMAEKLKATS